jgi:quercetin dioxygenase-like cupin family protein
MTIRIHRLPAALAILAGLTPFAAAETPTAPPAKVTTLITQDLEEVPGKEVVMLTVEYPPGGSSPPHRHDANVFVYVLEGSVIMQVEGQEAVTLGPGDTFQEKPSDVHVKAANASTTAPAKFVVTMVKDKGKPVSAPVTPSHSGAHD